MLSKRTIPMKPLHPMVLTDSFNNTHFVESNTPMLQFVLMFNLLRRVWYFRWLFSSKV